MMENQEIEIKFFVKNLNAIGEQLERIGAAVIQPRIYEVNLRFDTPASDLGRSFKVLRLRHDTEARLTYKGPSFMQDGARIRQEIEFTVSDFDRAQQFIEALGYQVALVYEKYRTTYEAKGVHITLDEMPYGDFVEIEGPNIGLIQSISQELRLNWESGVPASYTVLFEQIKQMLGLSFRDLTFENFRTISVTLADLGISPADLPG